MVIKKKTPERAEALGLLDHQVVAVRLTDGECPVGIVIGMSDEYFTLTLYNWLVNAFVGNDLDVPYSLVKSIRRATYETDGGGRRVYQMDLLGAYQTDWSNQHKAPSEVAE